MSVRYDIRPGGRHLPIVFMSAALAILWIAGGASRADALGQAVTRAGICAILVAAALVGPRPDLRPVRMPLWLLLAALALVLLQLVPLPPGVWQALPGRGILSDAAVLAGGAQPWRPLAMVPGAAMNAAFSLIVPIATLLLVASLPAGMHERLLSLVIAMVAGTAFLGLLQFSGATLDYPLVNDTLGAVSGNFANRNHFALFLAEGCLLLSGWAFLGHRQPRWRAPAALGLLLLFVLVILASGSRAGMAAGGLALAIGVPVAWRGIRRGLRHAPGWAVPALLVLAAAIVIGFVLLSVAADRAVAITRALDVDAGQDMRARGLPTVLHAIGTYFPFGSGFGGFDRIFFIHEPFALLKPTYFNHAHNEYLEIPLEGGLAGVLLLILAVGWWAWASIRAWRAPAGSDATFRRIGSAMLFLILFASIFDYPARTPLVMALGTIAAAWLAGVAGRKEAGEGAPALPRLDQHL